MYTNTIFNINCFREKGKIMIINPIIPIWLMIIICIIAVIIIIYNSHLRNITSNNPKSERTQRQKNILKNYIFNLIIKLLIVLLLFIINLRFMIPNGEAMATNSDVNILFVIDTSVSMRALDYNGNKERFEGVTNDCSHIVEELSNCKFSIITFADTAKKVIPFTTDTDMVQAELRSIQLEDDYYAKGSSMNIVKELLQKTLKEQNTKDDKSKIVVFFVTDGEITKEGENLESFEENSKYISNGAVLGYGTTAGGKMINSRYEDKPESDYYYLFYYEEFKRKTAISKLDESNVKQIANDLGIDYIQMSKTSNINYKINEIKKEISSSQTSQEKISAYKDIYYYFAIPLVILLIVDFIIKKRRMQ